MGAGCEKWAYSRNEEDFHGPFGSWEEAVLEAIGEDEGGAEAGVYVGPIEEPTQPDEIGIAEYWLDHVGCHDDYGGDWAGDWPGATRGQIAELDEDLRAVLGAWLDRHKLRPRWFIVPAWEYRTRAEAMASIGDDGRWIVDRMVP